MHTEVPAWKGGKELLGNVVNYRLLEMSEAAIIALRTEHARLLAEIGPLRTVLDRVVLFDDAPLSGELPRLKAGLEMLVGFFRIGDA